MSSAPTHKLPLNGSKLDLHTAALVVASNQKQRPATRLKQIAAILKDNPDSRMVRELGKQVDECANELLVTSHCRCVGNPVAYLAGRKIAYHELACRVVEGTITDIKGELEVHWDDSNEFQVIPMDSRRIARIL